MEDEDTTGEDLALLDSTQATTDDSADTTTGDSDGSQQAEQDTETLYAGKYKSPEDLATAYKELETKLGNYKTVEEKARAFDELSIANALKTTQAPPKTAQDFVSTDGTVDWTGYNDYVQKNTIAQATRIAREQIDVERAERDFSYLATDQDAADAVMALYRSGRVPTVYEAAKRIDNMRQGGVATARKEGAQEKEREIASKVKGQTTRASARTSEDTGLTLESFSKLSLDEKRKVVDSFAQ